MANFPRFDFDKFEKTVLHKPETLGALGALGSLGGNVVDFTKYCRSLDEDKRMELEERAAIMEHDGGLSRQEAEAQTLQNVIYMRDYRHDQ